MPRPQATDEITPRLIDAYVGRAAERTGRGKLDGAITDLTEALRLDPKRPTTLLDRGELYHRIGEHKRAVADFTEVIHSERYPCVGYLDRGIALLDSGNADAAIADFTEAIRLNRYTPFEAYCRRAEALLKKGDLAAALKDADAAIRVNPKYADAYQCRGRIHEKMGEKARAESDFAQARRLGDRTK